MERWVTKELACYTAVGFVGNRYILGSHDSRPPVSDSRVANGAYRPGIDKNRGAHTRLVVCQQSIFFKKEVRLCLRLRNPMQGRCKR